MKDLELFVAVAEAGSIAKAAQQCHTVASAVSKRISDMEASFHTALLVRRSKGVELTPAGHALLARSRGVLTQASQLNDELAEFASGVRGHVRVFANISSIVEFLPAALASFLSKHRDVRIHLEEHVSSVTTQAVAASVADVGIVSEASAAAGLTFVPFRKDELALVVSPGHSLAARKSLHFAEALDFDFVGLHSNSSLHYLLIREAAQSGRSLKLRIQVTSFDAVCAMVAAGLGVGIMPRAAATPYIDSLGLKSITLRDAWAKRKLYLCIRSKESLSSAAREFVNHLTGGVD
ncbi:MAG TPA: LysR family transcriptional regulator [Terriglobales bacterium]|nr:LysR family transcriptional regulator [Terriglobales bacterium]